jgi:hypothetical protein
MSFAPLDQEFLFAFNGETLGRMFMPRANSFEVLENSLIQEALVVDSLRVKSDSGECRLSFSEWEQDEADQEQKLWVSEYSIELRVNQLIAFGTYGLSYLPQQPAAGLMLERLRQDAEEDFMLCAKLLGRSVRRDLVIDELGPERPKSGSNLH